MTQLIANTKLESANDKGERVLIEVEIFLPEDDPESEQSDFRCLVRLGGLSLQKYVYGVDSFQSLSLALKFLEIEFQRLTDLGWRFYLPECADEAIDICSSYFLHL